MKQNRSNLRLFAVLGCIFTLPVVHGQILTTNWTGEHSGDRFNQAANWDEGVPSAGDTGNITDSRVELGMQAEMVVGATINFFGSSTLEANSNGRYDFNGVLNIADSTSVNISRWQVNEDATLNWTSTSNFSLAPDGTVTQPRFEMLTGSTVNMSAGTWDLTGTDNTDAMRVTDGTFNMTGGTINMTQRLRLDSVFNLGGTGAVYAGSQFINEGAVLNFEGTQSAFYLLGTDGESQINTRIGQSRIALDGVTQTDKSNFVFSIVDIDGVDYTQITAIPEPRAYAAWAGLAALALLWWRTRRVR